MKRANPNMRKIFLAMNMDLTSYAGEGYLHDTSSCSSYHYVGFFLLPKRDFL
jgi:hypothetical protein